MAHAVLLTSDPTKISEEFIAESTYAATRAVGNTKVQILFEGAFNIGGDPAVLGLYTRIRDMYGLTNSVILPVRYYPCTQLGMKTCLDSKNRVIADKVGNPTGGTTACLLFFWLKRHDPSQCVTLLKDLLHCYIDTNSQSPAFIRQEALPYIYRLADTVMRFPSSRFFKEFAGPDALISAVTTNRLTSTDIRWLDSKGSLHCITEAIGFTEFRGQLHLPTSPFNGDASLLWECNFCGVRFLQATSKFCHGCSKPHMGMGEV